MINAVSNYTKIGQNWMNRQRRTKQWNSMLFLLHWFLCRCFEDKNPQAQKKLQAFDYQQWRFDLVLTLRTENKFPFAECEKIHVRLLKGCGNKCHYVEIPLTARGKIWAEELTVVCCTIMLYVCYVLLDLNRFCHFDMLFLKKEWSMWLTSMRLLYKNLQSQVLVGHLGP